MSAWKRTVVSAFIAQIFSIAGFSFALPFLPFFIRDLGVTDPARQAWWAGLTLAATGLTMALFAPLWGALADRYGRKAMVIRSMVGGFFVLLLMSFAQSVQAVLVLRLLQGAVTGTVAASVALVASVTPQRRIGFALGMMQSALMIGVAIGPLVGGLVADAFGYRAAFRVGAVIVLLGGLLIHFGAHEEFSPPDAEEGSPSAFRLLRAGQGFLVAVVILLAVRFSNTIVNPAFPLIVSDLARDPARLNFVTGAIMSGAGVAGALSAAALGHAGDRIGHRRIVIACSAGAAVMSAAHALARSVGALALAHFFFGIAVAGTMPAANAMIRASSDPRHMGKAFGAASAVSLLGLAMGPLTGGLFARHFGLRAPFLLAAVFQVLVALLVARLGRRGPAGYAQKW